MARRRRDSESDRVTLAPGQLVRKIAEGGMGSVWEGEHLALRTSVAVKFVLDEFGHNAEAAARFDREATAAARIKSPHVVQVLDHGLSADGVAYIVMELLEGQDLEGRLDEEPKLPLELVAHIVLQTSKALEKAHGLGIVHRDIKPSNVYLTDLGGEIFVKILDFGIAKQTLGMGEQMRMTQTGAMIGTPVFMAPEQMIQAKDVGPPADMWSLAVVAYVAMTGKLPYESDTVAGLAVAIERGVFPAVSTMVPDLPMGIDAWFTKALAKDPADRFASIREMGDSIARIAGTLAPPLTALSSNRSTSTPPPAKTGPSDPPPAKKEALKSVDDEKTTVRGVPHSKPPPSGEAGATSAMAATVGASPSPWGSHATIMGASSEKARQEARSTTRTWVLASVAIVVLGGAAASYGVLRSREPELGTTPTHGPPVTATADNTPPQPSQGPEPVLSAAAADSGALSTLMPSASVSVSARSASASAKTSAPPPFRPPPPRPSASGSTSAPPPKPTTSAGAAPSTTAAKPPTSAAAPPTSAKPPPKPAPAPSSKP